MPSPSEDDLPTRLQHEPLPVTVASGAAGMGGDPDEGVDSGALPAGSRLGEFEILDKIGEGGFSIVYRAWDHVLRRQVALKEYFPSSIAMRSGQTQVGARSVRHRETFSAGLEGFIKEAQTLAGFDHPSLVKVLRFFPSHGTAYMVMPLYDGITLRDAVRAMPEPPDEAWLLARLDPLTQALLSIHGQGWFHRDIAPDNIMLIEGGSRPLLLDFGAARRVIGDMTQALTVILKPGYAPVEQYAEVPGMKQGAWTDVYALAATVFWAITGHKPPAAVGRMMNDTLVPLAETAAGRYSPRFLAALDAALKVRPSERTADMAQFRSALGLDVGAPLHRPPPAPSPAVTAAAAVPAAIPSVTPSVAASASRPAARPAASPAATGAVPATDGRGAPVPAWAWGAGVVLAVAAGGAWWWSQQSGPTLASPDASLPAETVPKVSPPLAPLSTPTPPAPAPAVAVPVPAPAPAATPAPKPAAAAKVEPRTEPRTESRAEPRSEPRVDAPARAATARPSSVCSGLMQRLSLGEDSPALREQLVSNRCQ